MHSRDVTKCVRRRRIESACWRRVWEVGKRRPQIKAVATTMLLLHWCGRRRRDVKIHNWDVGYFQVMEAIGTLLSAAE